MAISIADFKGELPHRATRLLPNNFSQLAVNTRLESGELAPVRSSFAATSLDPATQTFLQHKGAWRSWNKVVYAAPGPVAADRLYITGDGKPKMEIDATTYDLELPAPIAPPTIDVLVAPDELADTYEVIVLAFTWVTSFGEESAPSPLSDSFGWSTGAVELSAFPAPPANRAIDRVRIYQSQTSALGQTELYFKGEATLAELASPYDGVSLGGDLGELIPSANFDTPPVTMTGLTTMPNGMMVAFDGRELLFCEPYQPHAWPVAYRLEVDYPIVGLAAFGSNLAVLTTGQPYRGQGLHPDSFVLEKIEERLPCLSARGIVDLGYAAAYPSTNGLVLISSAGAKIITSELFTREQWSRLLPETIRAGFFDGRYVFAFNGALTGGTQRTAIIDLTNEQPFLIRTDRLTQAMYHELETGRLYLCDANGDVASWDDPRSADFLSQTWRSKLFDLPFPANYSFIEVIADAPAVAPAFELDVIVNGAVVATINTYNQPERLPGGFLERRWEVEVRGTVAVSAIRLANSLDALRGG